jgi:hypothetical protein
MNGFKITTVLILACGVGSAAPAPKPKTMFPDGLEHDFGRVWRGPQLRHSFRIVNTTNRPLRIISLRRA